MQLFSRLSTKAILTNTHMTNESLGFFLSELLILRKMLVGGGGERERTEEAEPEFASSTVVKL